MKLVPSIVLAAILALLFTFGFSFSKASPACPNILTHYDNLQINHAPSGDECFLSVNPRNSVDLKYRSFLFSNEGLVMVFNSYGHGPNSTTTGAREFYFFPRTQQVEFSYNAEQKKLEVTLVNGQVATFDTEAATLEKISGADITVDPTLSKTNRGGVDIWVNQSTYLDLGFTMGQSPSQNPTRKVQFKGKVNCTVKNQDIFHYTENLDVIFKFSDDQLHKFLNAGCK